MAPTKERPEFTRQKWRVWIETAPFRHRAGSPVNSPARNGGCGLKQERHQRKATTNPQFTRQKWRVWIETISICERWAAKPNSPARNGGCGLKLNFSGAQHTDFLNSPARNGGCGLKLFRGHALDQRHCNSPARNGGCGLKQHHQRSGRSCLTIHPPEMAGVD